MWWCSRGVAGAVGLAVLIGLAGCQVGPGLIAEDLPEELPKVFRALGL